jgi:hypothetical protein
MCRTRTVCLGLVSVLLTPALSAQQVTAPGSRVRVVGGDRQPMASGAFVRLAGDTVVVTTAAGTTQALIVPPGYHVEESVGMRRRTLRGMGIGLVAGAAAGAILGAASYRKMPCNWPCVEGPSNPFGSGIGPNSPGEMAVAGAVVLGVPGMVIGGIIGGRQREWWVPVNTLAPRVVLLPAGLRSVALTVSTNF